MLTRSELEQRSAEILIVGAGLTGMSAASKLVRYKKNVLVIDKGRDIGGRLTGTHIDTARFDKGAQFMTARDFRFRKQIDNWVARNLAIEWFRTPGDGSESHQRWRGIPDMRNLVRDLSTGVDVVTKSKVKRVLRKTGHLEVELDSGGIIAAETVLLTPPVPQCLEILKAGDIPLSIDSLRRLERITYDSCLAVMAVLDSPSKIPSPGALRLEHNVIDWISDNQQKGLSAVPAVTILAKTEFSSKYFTEPQSFGGKQLLQIAKPWLGASVVRYQVHAWRYSKPRVIHKEPFILPDNGSGLIIAGDAFSAPRVEGAVISGLEAADYILDKKKLNNRQ